MIQDGLWLLQEVSYVHKFENMLILLPYSKYTLIMIETFFIVNFEKFHVKIVNKF